MPEDPRGSQEAATGAATPGAPGGWLIAGRYRVLDRLGSGAMADVYRAHDETLDRDVAVKVFRTIMDDGDTAGNARRELELQALAQLSHPNLITLFDGSVSDDRSPSFLALELVEGPTLAAVLHEGALPEPQVRHIGAQIADALAYVHERGMVHRDVKPANILLGTDNLADPASMRARLSDFGIVRLVDSAQVTAADLTVGTAYYLAPEQARSAAVSPAADVYSLGLVLLEALTGARAFEGAMHEVLLARLSRDPEIPPGLPEPWPGLLAAMTAQDPAQRPSAADVARALRAVPTPATFPAVAGAGIAAASLAAVPAGAADAQAQTAAVPRAGIVAPPPSFPPSGSDADPEPARRHLSGIFLAAATFLALIAGAGWFLFHAAGQGTAPPQNAPVHTSSGTSGPSSGSSSSRRHHRTPGAAVPVDKSLSGTSQPGHRHRTHRSSAGTSAAPSTSARPRTSTPPSTPRSSTTPPTSASASTSTGTTSTPPSTSSSSPSSAASSAAATSAPASATVA